MFFCSQEGDGLAVVFSWISDMSVLIIPSLHHRSPEDRVMPDTESKGSYTENSEKFRNF